MDRAMLKKHSLEMLKNNWTNAVLGIVIYGALISLTVSTGIIPLIITGPLILGKASYFLKLNDGASPKIDNFFDGFKLNFIQSFILNIVSGIFIFLWTLLFIIPGVVKGLSYSMSFYIMVDNPQISAMDAIKESMRITDGHKWELFVLGLSFIGWSILCAFTFGIGYLWLIPYMEATYSGFYRNLAPREILIASEQ